MYRKIIFFVVLFSTLLFSNDMFNISQVKFGAYSFKTKTKMRINKNRYTSFNLPIEITSNRQPLEKTKTGYLSKSIVTIAFTAIKNDKMSIKTQRDIQYNKYHQLNKLTETINRNGETQTIVCIPLREELKDKVYIKAIGYKSDVVLLSCDDGNQMKMQSQLQKSSLDGLANFTTKKNFMTRYDNINYKIEETRKVTIDTNGTIHAIAEKVHVKDLFSLKYRTINISKQP